jgi:hypothetical protein
MGCRTKLVSRAALAALLCATLMIWAAQRPQSLAAQSTSYPPSQSRAPEWETAAGGKMAFGSVIVKGNTTTPPQAVYFNMPIGPGDISNPNNGGLFRAMNLPLSAYISFVYKMTGNQEEVAFTQAPKWVRTDRYDIQGKVEGTVRSQRFNHTKAVRPQAGGRRSHAASDSATVTAFTTPGSFELPSRFPGEAGRSINLAMEFPPPSASSGYPACERGLSGVGQTLWYRRARTPFDIEAPGEAVR